MSAKLVTTKRWECVCELPDCPGKGKPWFARGDSIPSQCRWCTRRTWNGKDLRTNVFLTALGKTQGITAWAKETGLSAPLIRARYLKFGWSAKDAVTVPPNGKRTDK